MCVCVCVLLGTLIGVCVYFVGLQKEDVTVGLILTHQVLFKLTPSCLW